LARIERAGQLCAAAFRTTAAEAGGGATIGVALVVAVPPAVRAACVDPALSLRPDGH